MILEALRNRLYFRRDDKHPVEPTRWRKVIFGDEVVRKVKSEGLKAAALQAVKDVDIQVASHDEAEAVLIAQYGTLEWARPKL
jgi:hypothetical protein